MFMSSLYYVFSACFCVLMISAVHSCGLPCLLNCIQVTSYLVQVLCALVMSVAYHMLYLIAGLVACIIVVGNSSTSTSQVATNVCESVGIFNCDRSWSIIMAAAAVRHILKWSHSTLTGSQLLFT